MDNVRVILWAVLASLLWLAATQWQKTYSPVLTTELAAVTTDASVAEVTPVEIPAAADAVSSGAAAAAPATAAVSPTPKISAEVVSIKTDVLEIDISLRGGNLVRATLPTYPVSKDDPNTPMQLLSNDPASLYVWRSGLGSTDGAAATHDVMYRAPQKSYELALGADEIAIPLIWQQDGIEVIKTYTFRRGEYAIGLDYSILNKTPEPYSVFSYQQLERIFIPVERSMFNVDTYSFDGPVVFDGESYEKLDAEDLQETPLDATYTNGWLAAIQHHFLSAAVPAVDIRNRYTASFNGRNYTLTASSPTSTIQPGASDTVSAQFFVGPKLQDQMAATAKGLPLTVDYGILAILAQPLFWILQQVQKIVVNWGWTIIIVTFMIKLVFYKLTQASGRSMAKMRKLQPRLKVLQDRYKDDRQAMSAALMDLYKREKVNPAAGCLPMLVQIPFFIAFYWVLLESVEMRQAPFMLWITDLSSRDPFFVLPLLMGAAMFIQQKLNPAPPDPIQAKVMSILPIIFTVFFAFFPAGLVLYWLTNSVLSILQQWNINRVVAAEAA
ncbi:MAG: membrane protein insertase YidC [Gammaproteobacteria bacterium]|nr:membrane protein insertase YidC [Gammaproteobacteria bacterium]